MMNLQISSPRLPHIPLPTIRSAPHIPGVGCAGSDTTTLIGEQLGNLPDLDAATHIKALKKAIEEQIYALIQGELPDATRPPVYAARAAELIDYVTEIVSDLNEIIGGVIAEATASINFINGKISDLSAAQSELLSIPEAARSQVQQLGVTRFNEYFGELNAQLSRLDSTISCIAG